MDKVAKILIVEDDPFLGMIVKECFETRDFEAHLYDNGEKGYQAYCDLQPDICILDVMMPLKDGFTLAEEIRSIDQDTPIIFLTAKSLTEDVLKGFTIGANDYVKKPFSMEELILRVKAILKLKNGVGSTETTLTPAKPQVYHLGQYRFDYEHQLLKFNDTIQKLTGREAELLKLLCDNLNQVLDRKLTLKKLWGDDTFFNARSMDVFITKIRKYLKEDPNIEIINIRGLGYKLSLLEEDVVD